MAAYDWIAIDAPMDYTKLSSVVTDDYAPGAVAAELGREIAPAVSGILVEHGYNDKDYRSTFYHYYSKKGRKYRDDCVRLHLFDASISFDPATNDLLLDGSVVALNPEGTANHLLEPHYYGFIVLRPTLYATIGRTILTPDVRSEARGQAIQARHRVHVLGHQLSVWGFPSMSQHTDISVCAHVSCWAILRHYSERFPQYRELLLHDITMLATQFDPGGITPGLGLKIYEAERILRAAGTYPVVVAHQPDEKDGSSLFFAQLVAYLESGFPVFVTIGNHAFVLNGYGWAQPPNPPPYEISHVWVQVGHFLAIDDHFLPYACVKVDALEASEQAHRPSHTALDLDGFIVPLPDKIYYPASAVEDYSLKLFDLLSEWLPTKPPSEGLLRRYFITTISALRRYVRKRRSELGDDLVNMIMLLDTPQFVWVIEFASNEEWTTGHISARAIIDATASPRDQMPVLFAHDRETAIAFDRSRPAGEAKGVKLQRSGTLPLGRMDQNLRPIRRLNSARGL